jgi:hypothetical protein
VFNAKTTEVMAWFTSRKYISPWQGGINSRAERQRHDRFNNKEI